jgi:D-threo-aldose 1-dehydrogenase
VSATLGHSSVRVSPLGFGAAPLGNLYRAISDAAAASTVDAAWDAGVRYFDTAPHYGLGLAERRLGAALGGRPRDQFAVSTKVGRLLVADPGGVGRDPAGFDVAADHRRVWDFSADGVRRSLDASLRRLGLDRVDVVLLHDPDEHWAEAVGQAYPALHELRAQGVVGAIGVGMNQAAMLTRFVDETEIDVVMVAGRLTLLDHSAAAQLLPACAAKGVSVLAAGVFNSGLLATDAVAAGSTYDYRPASPQLLARAAAIQNVAQRHGVALPTAALAFAARWPEVASVVVGMRSVEEVAANAANAAARVPTQLWTELVAARLVAPDAVFAPDRLAPGTALIVDSGT